MTYYSKCGWAPFGWTAEEISKEKICGTGDGDGDGTPQSNNNFNRKYIEDMMEKITNFSFDLDEKTYDFRKGGYIWDMDVEAYTTVELPGVGTIECYDDGYSENFELNKCYGRKFYHVDGAVTKNECNRFNGILGRGYGGDEWEDLRDKFQGTPRVVLTTEDGKSPNGGVCIATRKDTHDWGHIDPSTKISFMWRSDKI